MNSDNSVETQQKLVFAPFGSEGCGDDILFFEQSLLFAMQTVTEATGQFLYADIHDKIGGTDKKNQPVPPLSENEVKQLATRAECDAFIDGMLLCTRNDQTGALTALTVALRVTHTNTGTVTTPEPWSFTAFDPIGEPDVLRCDFDLLVAYQYRICETLLDALNVPYPAHMSTDLIQVTDNWKAYVLFIKGKRYSQIPETKLGFYEGALREDPNFYWAAYNAGMLYKTQTDYAKARKLFMRAMALTNDQNELTNLYFELGMCSIYLGDPKTARNFWDKAVELGVNNPSLYVNMGGTFEQEENWNEALRMNEIAVARFPNYHKGVVNLARLHAMFGRLDQAIPLYERALQLQPNDSLRHSILGGCYVASGDTAKAQVHLRRAIELEPNGDPALYAQQELDKIPSTDKKDPNHKRWGLF